MVEWFFGKLDDARNKGLEGKKHALMALLAIKPEYQRIGLGTKLLQWGLRKCDEEGLDCWVCELLFLSENSGGGICLKSMQTDHIMFQLLKKLPTAELCPKETIF